MKTEREKRLEQALQRIVDNPWHATVYDTAGKQAREALADEDLRSARAYPATACAEDRQQPVPDEGAGGGDDRKCPDCGAIVYHPEEVLCCGNGKGGPFANDAPPQRREVLARKLEAIAYAEPGRIDVDLSQVAVDKHYWYHVQNTAMEASRNLTASGVPCVPEANRILRAWSRIADAEYEGTEEGMHEFEIVDQFIRHALEQQTSAGNDQGCGVAEAVRWKIQDCVNMLESSAPFLRENGHTATADAMEGAAQNAAPYLPSALAQHSEPGQFPPIDRDVLIRKIEALRDLHFDVDDDFYSGARWAAKQIVRMAMRGEFDSAAPEPEGEKDDEQDG